MLKRVIGYAHDLLKTSVEPGETVIDGTCGNGNDTLFLSKLVGNEGKVLAFDIQEQAITNTKKLLDEHNVNNVTLLQEDHQFIENYLSDDGEIGGAIFNLGYLPGSDKTVITKPTSTIKAVEAIASSLKNNRLLILVVYHGHSGGDIERDALLDYVSTFDQKKYSVARYGFINQRNNPPFVIAIEKK